MSLQQPPAPRRRGGQTIYTQEMADEICERLAQGEPLDTICADAHMPAASTVRSWASDATSPFAAVYARARLIGIEKYADEVIAISDAPCMGPDGFADNGLVQKQRLQAESRKWLLSKLLPKQFGDKVTQELVGDPNQPIVTRIELVPVAPLVRLPKRRDGGSDGGSIE